MKLSMSKRNHKFKFEIPLMNKVYLLLSGLFSAFLSLVLPFSILIIFDRIVPNESYDSLFVLISIIIISILLNYWVKKTEDINTNNLSQQLGERLNSQLFDAITSCNFLDFKQRDLGDYIERIALIPDLKQYFGSDRIKLYSNGMICGVSWLMISIIHPASGLVVALATLAIVLISLSVSKKRMHIINERRANDSSTSSKIIEFVSNPLEIKAKSMEFRLISLLNQMIDKREHYNISVESGQANHNVLLQGLQQVTIILIVILCAANIINHTIGQGAMAAVVLLTNRFFGPLQSIISTVMKSREMHHYLFEIEDILDLKTTDNAETLIDKKSNVITAKIDYLTFKIDSNYLYRIEGPSASGKSMFCKALMRESVPNGLEIMFNEQNIQNINLNQWRQHVTKVSSNSKLIEGSLIDNITCFRVSLNQAALALCENFGIKSTIDALPQGFQTAITGTTQLPISKETLFILMIIQALLSDCKVLIVDDIDLFCSPRTTAEIMHALQNQSNRITSLVVTNHPFDRSKTITFDNPDLVRSF